MKKYLLILLGFLLVFGMASQASALLITDSSYLQAQSHQVVEIQTKRQQLLTIFHRCLQVILRLLEVMITLDRGTLHLILQICL